MTMIESVLDVRNLEITFPDNETKTRKVVVNNVSFTLQPNQILGIVGESGSGKSITSLAVMGLIPNSGKATSPHTLEDERKILFRPLDQKEPTDLLTLTPKEWINSKYRGGKIAMIFQDPMSSLNPVYTIGYQITESILLHQKITQEQAKEQAIDLLRKVKLFPGNEELEARYLEKFSETESNKLSCKDYINQQKQAILKRYPHELSGGQLQRVMIAMAISCNPTLLIADEPTTALDVTIQDEIIKLLRELCKNEQMSMIFISHDLGVIANIADAVAVMYKGNLVEYGEIKKILFNPEHPYTKGLLACRPDINKLVKKLPTVSDYMDEQDDKGEIILKSKEPPMSEIVYPQDEQKRLSNLEDKPPILEVQDLRVYFPVKGVFGQAKDVFKAVDGVSFTVKEGEILGLVGESGCGKSTLARTILRLITKSEGKICFRSNDGVLEDISKWSMSDKRLQRLRKNMQIVFQNPYNSLNPRLTVSQTIIEPLIIHNDPKWPTKKDKLDRVKELLEKVKLNPEYINRYPHELSGGERQRVCIARALALNPQFIIFDESVSALDVSVQAGILNLLKDLKNNREAYNLPHDLTYIFISHDLSVVRFMSDRIIVMNKGKIEEEGTADEIINNPQQKYTQRLIASIPKFPEALIDSNTQN